MDFSKLTELNEKRKSINKEVKQEEEKLRQEALNEKGLKIGDKISYNGREMFLGRVFVVYQDLSSINYFVSFEAKAMKKDGTPSLNNVGICYPNFDKVEKA